MIGYLTGTFQPPGLVITDAGVGYRVATSCAPTAGDTVELYVHTVVRENELSLYGFVSPDEMAVFERLCGLPKVGPKVAMAIVRDVGLADVIAAVAENDAALLTAAAGVGPKLAGSIVSQLSLPEELVARCADTPATDDDRSVIDALVGLGYGDTTARQAAIGARQELPDGDVSGRVRAAIALAAAS